MPKSARQRVVSLTKCRADPTAARDRKQTLVNRIRSAVEDFSSLYVFEIRNSRNKPMKQIRSTWSDSRFFMGKNKVMMLALGRTEAEEYRDGLCAISKMLVGNTGLLFTDRPKEEVMRYFQSDPECRVPEFAKSGFRCTRDVILHEGPILANFPTSAEPMIRGLGLPTAVRDGKIVVVKEHVVCREGDVLTPDQCKILKHLGLELSVFSVELVARWSADGIERLR
eukprot:gnl/Spiro4/25475_TR12706_c0_g3_i1.p2 gnl/Spiro4/25475_TR12706_c0_g3~~gnl/Spiro4/25475_TR12706_c0_g3_i1.p2  ORF type:complete len:225 (+),score=29.82 gnl/Spiro4/25475_TR12706_c0_g3_i1:60-734(+)